MRIDILTIFPEMFSGPFEESMVKRAREDGKVEIKIHNLRDWSKDKHKSVDDRPYGGGAGMGMRVDVIDRALDDLKLKMKSEKCKVVLMSAKGKKYTQQDAKAYTQLEQLILIAGHYEGVDERVAKFLVDEELRIGDYVLTGGELPAMVVVDSVVRLLPGVLGNEESLTEESYQNEGEIEYPQYTRPEEYKGWKVPEILLSGHHAKIAQWRNIRVGKFLKCCWEEITRKLRNGEVKIAKRRSNA